MLLTSCANASRVGPVMNHQQAIEALLALPAQGRRAASYSRSWLNLSPRRVGAIRRSYEGWLRANGISESLIPSLWSDVRDMVELEHSAE